ncbi:4-hydroxybenzoate octaprenyltransferase [Blastomonas sp.]|uniref:4-hydroxybenzoate octaprenyltransferase n=1 Tax=Blastomonas sp. TaxID=1909299 RepID=UPI00260B256E|nr:4-hydroxybenzoate octaprenyltransferase [Blastomonas sp.]MDM7956051.1 4-hydroxybenzoate octaprenyltransferase [Blastomonas sp.]
MTTTPLPDTETRGLLALLPAAARPYALLARFDRPIGWWLLYWPCAFALALSGGLIPHWPLLAWMLLGAIAMRGAGCVYNDIVDRDLDARVARTRGRPLASGAVSLKAAWAWLLVLCLIGLVVLVQLTWIAALIAIGSLALVAAYPFMKRITWWPQVWLGLVFSWGALVAWAAVADALPLPALLLYGGCIAWVIGYDTIYALQDVEDDALVGIRSSARAMGGAVKPGVAVFYALALGLWAAAIWAVRPDMLALAALLPVAGHLAWQVAGLKPSDPLDPLNRFRSNRTAGLLAFLAFATVGLAG